MKKVIKKRKTFDEIVNESREKLYRFFEILKSPQPLEFLPGQIWTTQKEYWSPNGVFHAKQSHLVLILKGIKDSADFSEPDIEASLILPEIWMATDKDLLLPESHPLLGSAIITFENVGPILTRNLDRCLGVLEREILNQCEKVWQHADGLIVEDIHKLPIGRPLFSTADMRFAFHKIISQETRFLWEPAISVAKIAEQKVQIQEFPNVFELSKEKDEELTREIYYILGSVPEEIGAEQYAAESISAESLKRGERKIEIFNKNIEWGFSAHLNYLITEVRFELTGQKIEEILSVAIQFFEPGTDFRKSVLESFTVQKFEDAKDIRFFFIERRFVELMKLNDMEISINLSTERYIIRHKNKF